MQNNIKMSFNRKPRRGIPSLLPLPCNMCKYEFACMTDTASHNNCRPCIFTNLLGADTGNTSMEYNLMNLSWYCNNLVGILYTLYLVPQYQPEIINIITSNYVVTGMLTVNIRKLHYHSNWL